MFYVSTLLALCMLVFGPHAASSSLSASDTPVCPRGQGLLLLNATCADCLPGYFCAAGSLNTFGGGAIVPITGANISIIRFRQNVMMVTTLVENLDSPRSVVLDGNGLLYFTSFYSDRVMRVELSTGITTLVAGLALSNVSFADGTGTNAAFNQPVGAALDSNGSLFVADSRNHRIRQVNVTSGVVSTLAGNGTGAFADGVGTLAALNLPLGVAADLSGNLYVADSGNHRIRRIVIATGAVSTVAGTGLSGFVNGIGALATFTRPSGIALDSFGNLFVADSSSNGRIRQVVISSGYVTLLAGGGNFRNAPDGVGSNAYIAMPAGSACDLNGNLIVVETNAALRQIVLATGRADMLAGANLAGGPILDGIGTSASFNSLNGIAIDGRGNMFLADSLSIRLAQTTTPCFPGYYCPGGAPVPWQAGSFSANAGLSSPLGGGKCSASYFCPSGSSSATQVACAQGTYCPTTGLSAAVPCPAGSFCSDPALQAVSGPCQAGFYCPPRSVSATAVPCSSGDYCAAGASARARCPATFYCENPDVKVACPLGTFCPAGSSAFSASCPAGCFCSGGGVNAAVQCSPGSYCVNGAALPCPTGSVCPVAGLTSPLPCPSGRFCSSTGLSTSSGDCGVGQICPAGAKAPQACPLGFLCAVPGLAAPQSCPSGSACSATAIITQQCAPGTYAVGNASACTPCPSGTFNDAAGRSACTPCAFGTFAASATAAACVPCPSGYLCFLGGHAPVAVASLATHGATDASTSTAAAASDDPSTASASSNPFAASLETRKRALNALLVSIGSGGAALVLLSFVFAIVAHLHAPTRRCVFGDDDDGVEKSSDSSAPAAVSSTRAQMWAQIDVFFSLTHFTPNGSLVRRRKTSFGGMLSVVCALAIAMLGSMFATKNLLNPTYVQSVSATALPFEPRGTFRLGARVFGGGAAFDNGCANMSMDARASDWLVGAGGALGMVNGRDAGRVVQSGQSTVEAGGARSCQLTWQCTQCQMVTASSPVLALRSLQSSWVTFVNFTFEAPPLVVLAGSSSASVPASALSNSKVAPVPAADESIVGGAGLPFVARASIAPQPSVLRGALPTRVTLSLVGVAVQTLQPSAAGGSAQATAFTPFVEPFAIGAAMDAASFAFESATTSTTSADTNANANGFQIEFVLQRSTIQIAWTIDTSAYYNVLVLIGSLVGTVVYVFATILQLLEHYARIPSAGPAGSTSASASAGAHSDDDGTRGRHEAAATADAAVASGIKVASSSASAATVSSSLSTRRRDNHAVAFAAFDDEADDDGSDGVDDDGGSVAASSSAGARASGGDHGAGVRADQCAIELQPVSVAAAPVAAHALTPAEMTALVQRMQLQISSLLEARRAD